MTSSFSSECQGDQPVVLGQAVVIIQLIGSIALASILLLIVWRVADTILPKAAAAASTTPAANANEWLTLGAEEALPVFFLFVIFAGGIARAAYQRRVGR